MSDKPKPEAPVFRDEDYLLLLQLTAKRAVAERRASPPSDDPEGTVNSAQDAVPPQVEVPRTWRLVPQGVSLYDWQRECLPLWLEKKRGTVKVATGGGKTLFALAAAQRLQNEYDSDLRLVVVVPTIPLMHQWHDELRKGNLPEAAIGLMGGGSDLPQPAGLRAIVCVLNSAREKLPAFVEKSDWAGRMLLVVDECHRSNATQAQRIFGTNPAYTLGLSATPEPDWAREEVPFDDVYEKSAVGRALGPIIYDFTINQSLAAGLLTPFEVWHIGLPLTPKEETEHSGISREISELRKALQPRHRASRSKQGFIAWCQYQAGRGGPVAPEAQRFIGLANQRKRLLYRAAARAEVAVGILADSLKDPGSCAILFHESIDETESLFLGCMQLGLPVVLEHSQLPESLRAESIQAFRQGVARGIISAKSLVEGFNIPSADLGIIVASTSSVRQRVQSLGRMLRRKAGGRTARIVVLYIRGTEDESLYEKADWESIIGAERNRYFEWKPLADKRWPEGLEEVFKAPRTYRPPSWEVDADSLSPGDPYPGQVHGYDVRVDQALNLRGEDGALIPATPEIVKMIGDLSPSGRARLTPTDHLIVRASDKSGETDWTYLGQLKLPKRSPDEEPPIRLRIRAASGRREIALEDTRAKGVVLFALGPGLSMTPQGGQARDRLLEWVRSLEAEHGISIRDIFWDQSTAYWVEIAGQRIHHSGPLPPLEFKR